MLIVIFHYLCFAASKQRRYNDNSHTNSIASLLTGKADHSDPNEVLKRAKDTILRMKRKETVSHEVKKYLEELGLTNDFIRFSNDASRIFMSADHLEKKAIELKKKDSKMKIKNLGRKRKHKNGKKSPKIA